MPVAKSEAGKNIKPEPSQVKREQHGGIKQEILRAQPKQERGAGSVKNEAGSASNVKTERALPSIQTKMEQLRKVKSEMGVQGMAALLARGEELKKENVANTQKAKVAATRGKAKSGTKLIKVKQERTRNKDGKLRKKTKYTAKGRRARREAMAKEIALSDELSDLLGEAALSRPETVRRLWMYCKEKGMLNPEDKREIIFDDALTEVMGKPTARMHDLMGLLVPHFDYTRDVAEVKKEMKTKIEMKQEMKAEKKENVKEETKRCAKIEKATASSVKSEMYKKAKTEPVDRGGVPAKISIAETLSTSVPRLLRFDHTSVVVNCTIPNGITNLEVVATPVSESSPSKTPSRAPCKIEVQECVDGFFESCAEARLERLDPKQSYRIVVQHIGDATESSCEVRLPQRVSPKKWTQQEVAVWCMSQQVPELAQKAKEYGIDGTTLLSLFEEDLRSMGLTTPFLLRRVTAGLEALRAAGRSAGA